LEERGITKTEVEKVVANPGEVLDAEPSNRKIAQTIISKAGKKFLYRVVYDSKNGEKKVITAYRTTKIKKCLREGKK